MSHRSLGLGTALLLSLPAQALAQANSPSERAPAAPAGSPVGPAAPPDTAPAPVDAQLGDQAPPPAASPETAPASSTVAAPTSAAGALASPAAAEPRSANATDDGPPSLLGDKVVIGGYGSLDVAYTRMFGEDGALVGLEGALLLNHRFSIGLAGYGWTNSQSAPPDLDGTERRFDAGYLGGTLRYSAYTDLPAYLTVGVFIGGGGIILGPRDRDAADDHGADRTHADTFLVVQPDLAVHVNITRWLRLGAVLGYRLTAGVGRFGFSESDVNGVVAGGHLQFGRF